MAKTNKRRRIIKRLDNLVREVVRLRDDNTCQRCGKRVEGSDSQPSHVIPKGRCLYLRWDLLNVKLLCMACHRWWHLNPIAAAEWFKAKFPARYAYVKQYEHQRAAFKIADLERIEEVLKEKRDEPKKRIKTSSENRDGNKRDRIGGNSVGNICD